MLNADLIQELKTQIDLIGLFRSYGMEPKKQGGSTGLTNRSYKVSCPFHDDENPSLSITPEKNLWQCFGCGIGGDAVKLIQKMEDVGFVEAVRILASKAGRLSEFENPNKNPKAKTQNPKEIQNSKSKKGKPILEYQLKERPTPLRQAQCKLDHPSGGGDSTKKLSVEDKELLNKVAGFYHRRFLDLDEGKQYLKKRGIDDPEIFKEHRIGYADGSLLTALPRDYIPKLKKLDILLESGKERFINCVVFPLLDSDGNVVSFYGRHVKMDSGGHFYLPGEKRGLFNRQQLLQLQRCRKAIKNKNNQKSKQTNNDERTTSNETDSRQEKVEHINNGLIITESIIDSLSFIKKGIVNVLPIYGVNGFADEHKQLIEELQPEQIILALDGDDWGQRATEFLIQEELILFNCSTKVAVFPNGMDANEWFVNHTKDEFYELLNDGYLLKTEGRETTASLGRRTENSQTSKLPTIKSSKPLNLQIKYIDSKNGKLSVTIKADASRTSATGGKFILDTYNLYSSKQRETLINELAKLYKIKKDEAEKEVNKLIEIVENKGKIVGSNPQLDEQRKTVNELTDDEKSEALQLLKAPDLLSSIVQDYEAIGYTGEKMNKKLAYLVMTSRKMQSPLSLVIMSNSAAGKSSLQEATLEFCPDEDKKHFTRLTQQSLYYLGDDSLKHKFLSIEEEEGSSEASYSLKTLLSAKKLQVISTTHDPNTGKKRADEYKTEGPVAVMVSTTSPEIEAELASRTLIISIDESHEQTGSIHDNQRTKQTLEGRKRLAKKEKAIKRHQNAQRLLDIELEVVNEYAPQLTFPVDRLKYRRGNKHYLGLIDTIAFLRQKQKEAKSDPDVGKYIEVDKEDIRIANELFTEIMGWYVSELKKPTKDVLRSIIELCKQKEDGIFTRRELREYCNYSTGHLHRHLKKLEELEYIVSVTGSNGSRYMYQLIYDGDLKEDEKFVLGLKDVNEL